MSQTTSSRGAELLDLIKNRRLDVITASTYGVDRYSHPWMAADPSFQRVLQVTDDLEHIFALHLSYYASFGVTDVLGVDDPEAVQRRVWREDGATHYHLTLHTPGGDLTANYTENDGIHTVWRHDPLIKTGEDIQRLLSAHLTPAPLDAARFLTTREALDGKGLMEIEMPDPLCLVVENMSYEDFMVRSLHAPAEIEGLLDLMSELLVAWLERVLAAGFGPIFRIFGPEYAAPPMMAPAFFRRAVVERDRPLIDMIHRAGGFVRYHCHGPISRILEAMLELGVDMTDPCEAPPSGDLTLRQLADRVGQQMVLMGNIQLDDIERAEADTIDRLVSDAVDAAGGRAPFILCTTAFPFSSPLPAVTERNLIRFLQAREALCR